MKRKPADKPTEFVPDLLKIMRTAELSNRELADALGQEYIHRVTRWTKALSEQGMLRRRELRRPRMAKIQVYTLARVWGGEVDR